MPRSEVPPADVNPAECSAVEPALVAAPKKLRPRGQIDPVLFGSGCGLAAAFIYTCSNTCLRQVAHCDPLWVATMKAGPTFAVAALILAVRVARQLPLLAAPRVLIGLTITGLIGQWLGNVGFQIGLKYVGLALSVPLTLGLTIIGGALLGRFWLNEPITRRSVLATLVLLVAVPILTAGAERSGPPEVSATEISHAVSPFWLVAFGVVATCGAGLAYALQGAVLRKMATSPIPNSLTLLMLSGTGCITLGLASLGRLGWDGLLATPPGDFKVMVWAGLFNALGFFMLTKALELISMVHANAINASQVAMAALAGVLVFSEPVTTALVTGVGLTVVGMLLIDRRSATLAEDGP